jgi:hypothetical protein
MILQDIRHAIRVLASTPGFTAVAILSLALGIGANTAIFSLVNSVLMTTLPVRSAQDLVMLTDPGAQGVSVGMQDGERSLVTYTEFRQLQEQTGTFASMMASSSSLQRTEARVAGGQPEEIAVRLVSSSYFATLGVAALVGQTFEAGQEAAAGTTPAAVISHEFWQRRFGGRADALGQSVAFRGGVVSVIGVMPASFFGETVGERPDVWVPLAMQAAVLPGRDWLHDKPGNVEKVMWLHAFARLAPGVSLDQAQAHANVVFQQGLATYYGSMADAEKRKQFLDQRLVLKHAATGASSLRNNFSEPLFVLLGAAGLVLLIACSNGRAARAWRKPRAAGASAHDRKPVSRIRWRRCRAPSRVSPAARSASTGLGNDCTAGCARRSSLWIRLRRDACGRSGARTPAIDADHEDSGHHRPS